MWNLHNHFFSPFAFNLFIVTTVYTQAVSLTGWTYVVVVLKCAKQSFVLSFDKHEHNGGNMFKPSFGEMCRLSSLGRPPSLRQWICVEGMDPKKELRQGSPQQNPLSRSEERGPEFGVSLVRKAVDWVVHGLACSTFSLFLS